MPVPALRLATLNCKAGKYGVSIALGVALLCCGGSALSQVSGTLTVASDYRYRGVSLSDNEPAIQLGLTYDDPRSWYAGAFVSTVESAAYESHGVQAIVFAGYTWRMQSGLTVEAGADYSVVTAEPRFDYPEVYVGFTFQDISGRLYYAPRYFGQDSPAVYAEINLAHPLRDNISFLAHVGFLASNAKSPYGSPYAQYSSSVVDGAAGIGITWEGFHLQLSWVGVNQLSGAYGITGSTTRNGVVASVSHSF